MAWFTTANSTAAVGGQDSGRAAQHHRQSRPERHHRHDRRRPKPPGCATRSTASDNSSDERAEEGCGDDREDQCVQDEGDHCVTGAPVASECADGDEHYATQERERSMPPRTCPLVWWRRSRSCRRNAADVCCMGVYLPPPSWTWRQVSVAGCPVVTGRQSRPRTGLDSGQPPGRTRDEALATCSQSFDARQTWRRLFSTPDQIVPAIVGRLSRAVEAVTSAGALSVHPQARRWSCGLAHGSSVLWSTTVASVDPAR